MVGWLIAVGLLAFQLGVVIGFVLGLQAIRWWLKKKLEVDGQLEDLISKMK